VEDDEINGIAAIHADPELRARIEQLLVQRAPLYEETAHLTFQSAATNPRRLVRRLLEDISTYDGRASHADILQAMEIVSEVRFAMSEVTARSGADFSARVLGIEVRTEALAYAA